MKNLFRKTKVLLGAVLVVAVATGCGGSREDFVITNTANLAGPSAANDAFPALGNATLNQTAANGVLTNDVTNGAAISAFDAVGSQGGAINLNADGSFTYTPVNGFVGAETFTYTLSNNAGASTATVTVTSTGLGRFVDNTAPNGGNGSQASPFNTLADAVAAAQNGDTIFVDFGDGTNTGLAGGFNLPAGVNLVGEGTGLILAQTIVPAGQAPTIEGPITCGGDNTIQGLTIDGSASDLIIVNGVGNVTVDNNTLSNPTLQHINCDDVTGTITINNNTLDNQLNVAGDYIRLDNNNANAIVNVTGNTFLNLSNVNVDSLCEMYADGTSELTMNLSNNTANGTQAGQFSFGLYFENNGTGDCTMDVDGNNFSNFNGYPIGMFAFPGPLTGSVTSNQVSDVTDYGIWVYAGGGTVTVSGNTVADTETGLRTEFDGPADAILVVENNNVSNSANNAIYVGEQNDDTDNKVAIRDNSCSGTTGVDDLLVFVDDNGTLCCDVTGNTFTKNATFDNEGGGVMSVERRDANDGGPLDGVGVNTFNNGSVPVYDSGTITSVGAGICQIP